MSEQVSEQAKKKERVLIKLGGSVLQDDELLASIVEDIAYFQQKYQVIIVHGGGPAINLELTNRQITWSFVDGLRVTTPAMMDVIESVLCETVNPRIVSALRKQNIQAMGFSGASAKTILCQPKKVELGLVGEVIKIQTQWLENIIEAHTIPVIAPVGVDIHGQAYNINADTAAAQMAMALKVNELIYLTDQDGIWDQDKKILPRLNSLDLKSLVESQVVQGGMRVKVDSIQEALKNNINGIRILNAKQKQILRDYKNCGTLCIL